MSQSQQAHLVEKFKADVLARVEQQHEEGPGRLGASFDGSKIRGLVHGLDHVVQQIAPVIATLTPAQYAAYVTLAANILHGIAGQLPATPEAS